MRLKGSFTLENSVIIPLFTLIIVSLIFFVFSLHDRVIIKNTIFQTGIISGSVNKCDSKSERISKTEDIEKLKQVEQESSAYLKSKTLLLKNGFVSIKEEQNNFIITANGLFNHILLFIPPQSIEKEYQWNRSKCVETIRVVDCMKDTKNNFSLKTGEK